VTKTLSNASTIQPGAQWLSFRALLQQNYPLGEASKRLAGVLSSRFQMFGS
jgi:hypothetical protein